MVAGGGARIDDEPIKDAGAMIAVAGDDIKISAGKKKHGLLRRAL